MATTFFDITSFPKNTIAGVQFQFRVSAKDSTGAVDTTFTGTVVFTSSDPLATLPAAYTFVGGDSGTRLFKAKMGTIQASTVTVTSGAANGTARTTAWRRPLGWGLDDNALLPYGDAASGIGSSLAYARAFSTREVDITVTNFVQDNSSFLAGDALNPSTWSVQRLDTTVFLTVVQVTQQNWRCINVVDRDVEEALNLVGVQVHGQDAVNAHGLQHVGHHFGRDGYTA